ncbi:unnamed protein product [Closterium sp. Naga37s-1]|nr:unnamed protein product [Closterium sp. Naga37s-1]
MQAHHAVALPILHSTPKPPLPSFPSSYPLAPQTLPVPCCDAVPTPVLQDSIMPAQEYLTITRVPPLLSVPLTALYPEYWEELRGMAAGSTVPFDHLLLLNLRKEFGAFLPSLNAPATSAVLPESATLDRRTQYGIASDDCTDVLLLTDDVAAVGHNEDADYSIVDNSFFIHMHTGSGLAVTAYTYAGELPSVAFAFNDTAMAFTMDAVPPAPSEVVRGGIARNFLARSLMEARCIEDALQRVTGPAVAVGHHYVLMDFARRRIVSVETASNGRHSILELGRNPQLRSQGESEGEKAVEVGREESERGVSGSDTAAAGAGSGGDEGTAYVFHANAYTRLQVREKMGPSSHRRQATATRLGAPTTTQGMLQVSVTITSSLLKFTSLPRLSSMFPSHPSLSPLPLTPPSIPSYHPSFLPARSPVRLTPPSHPAFSCVCVSRYQILSNADDEDFPIFNAGKVYDMRGALLACGLQCCAGVASGAGRAVWVVAHISILHAAAHLPPSLQAPLIRYLSHPPSPFPPASRLLPPGPVIHTLHSALFNLDARTLTVLGGRPAHGNVLHEFHV